MRSVRCARPPNDRANPGQCGENQVHDRSHHENVERAVPVTEAAIDETENAIAQTEKEPSDQTGGQEIPRHAKKTQNWNSSKKAKDCSGSDVALQRKALQKRNMIGNHQPRHKNQSEANPRVHAGANGGVAKDVKPTVSR